MASLQKTLELTETIAVPRFSLQSQLGITEGEFKDLVTQRERKMEEIKRALKDIKVSSAYNFYISSAPYTKLFFLLLVLGKYR